MLVNSDGLSMWQAGNLRSLAGISHGVFLRRGGDSRPPYATLNLGLHTGDRAEDVIRNRERALAQVGLDLNRTVAGAQVHGARVACVDTEQAGRGARRHETALPGVDALVTADPGIALIAYFADCLPVLIADPRRRLVAIAHAGWRGTLAGVAAATVRSLVACGARVEDVLVALGPYIRSCCYEVGDDVYRAFQDAFGESPCVRSQAGRQMIDLAIANRVALERVGIPPENIDSSSYCTACRTDLFFSHRVEGPRTGRMAGVITLKHEE